MWQQTMQTRKRAAPLASALSGGANGPVEVIKNLQRTDPEGKEQWIAYCDLNGGGQRDPNKHDASFIQYFLSQYQSGTRLAGETEGITAMTKLLQKRSTPFKNAWASYCSQNGDGKNDPSHHPAGFHIQFYDHLAQMASGGGMMSAMMGMDMGESPMKKRKPNPSSPNPMMQIMQMMMGMPPTMMPGAGGGGGGVKDKLVATIKAFQRESEQQKEMWGTYCDSNLGGVRDPMRHDASVLREFCNNFGLPVTGGHGPQAAASDPGTAQLVARVKAFQKSGEEQKQAWWSFCGPVRDPARKSAAELQSFIAQYGIP